MSQTSVIEQGDARIGLLADSSLRDIVSFAAETALPFGRFVARGTKPTEQCKLPAAAGDITDAKKGLGVVIASQTVEVPLDSTADPQYPQYRNVPVLTFGRVWVLTESASTDTTKSVYVRHAVAGALNQLGAFSDAAGAGLEELSNAKWWGADQVIDGKRLALLQLRLT